MQSLRCIRDVVASTAMRLRTPEDDSARREPGLLRVALVTLVVFFVADVGCWNAGRHLWYAAAGESTDARVESAAYAGADWAEGYWHEFREAFRVRYRPYIGWQRRDFAGQHINIEGGVRRTWRAAESAAGDPRVFVLGGSTAWGTGARDDGTIPSWLARLSAGAGATLDVVNLGESGYQSWQETLGLAERCAAGDVPDVAVFYDGINDVFARVQRPEGARPHLNQGRAARRYDATRDGHRPMAGLWAMYQHFSLTMHLLRETGGSASGGGDLAGGAAASLADRAVVEYLANQRVVRALAREYGFEVLFVWQPTAYTRASPSAEEVGHAEAPGPLVGAMYRHATARLRDDGGTVDASGALDGLRGTVYSDWMHLNEDGNRAVAELILEHVTARLHP